MGCTQGKTNPNKNQTNDKGKAPLNQQQDNTQMNNTGPLNNTNGQMMNNSGHNFSQGLQGQQGQNYNSGIGNQQQTSNVYNSGINQSGINKGNNSPVLVNNQSPLKQGNSQNSGVYQQGHNSTGQKGGSSYQSPIKNPQQLGRSSYSNYSSGFKPNPQMDTNEDEPVNEQNSMRFDLGIKFNMQVEVQ